MNNCNEAININPKSSLPYYNRGLLKYHLMDKEGAIKDWSKAIEINPQFINAYKDRGIAYEEKNNRAAACTDWRKASRLGDNITTEWVIRSSADYRQFLL